MDSSIPSVQTQPGNPSASSGQAPSTGSGQGGQALATNTTVAAQVVQPAAPAPILPWYKTFLQKMATNKAFALFMVMNIVSLTMGSYILLAPSNETVSSNAKAFVPANTPTPLPIVEPTTIPTATPEPTIIEVEPTEEPAPTPTPTPIPDPTDNWNTYNNVAYGYTIKYPLNWTAINMGVLEPKIPSYIVFNENTATTSARSITVSVSSRTYSEQLAINGPAGSPYTVAGIQGTWQDVRDSDGNTSIAITLPRTDSIFIIRAKTAYASTMYQMLPTIYITE